MALVTQIPDYPSPGVMFQDFSALLRSYKARDDLLTRMAQPFLAHHIDVVAGLESRGLMFASALADKFKTAYVSIRKASGKLPGECHVQEYGTEYSKDSIKIGVNDIKRGDHVLIVDDLIATGGSAQAARLLVEKAGGIVVGYTFAGELIGLDGRKKLTDDGVARIIHSAFQFDAVTGKLLAKDYEEPGRGEVPVNSDSTFRYDTRGIVFYCPSLKRMAKNYINLRGKDKWRLGGVQWDYFPDGKPDIKFEHQNNLCDRNVVYFMSMTCSTPSTLDQVFLAMVLPKQDVRSLEIIVPFFATATHERVTQEGVLASADTMSKVLTQGMSKTRTGLVKYTFVDIHALQQRFYFSNDVHIRLVTTVDVLKARLHLMREPVVIAMPDDGCYKRYANMFQKEFPIIVFNKVRDGDKRYVKLKDNRLPSCDLPFLVNNRIPDGVRVMLIDDLVQSGNTLYETAIVLKDMGATLIDCFVAHAVFPDSSYRSFCHGRERDIFDHFFVTNTVPETTDKLKNWGAPFEVLDMSGACLPTFDADHSKTEVLPQILCVASTSPVKFDAASLVFGETHQLIKFDSPSRVPEQPLGHTQIWMGATNRIKSLMSLCVAENVGSVVSIENGVVDNKLDLACVCYYSVRTKRITVGWSESVQVPEDAYNAWLTSGHEDTIGDHVARLYPGASATNWSETLYGLDKSRVRILERALVKVREVNGQYQ